MPLHPQQRAHRYIDFDIAAASSCRRSLDFGGVNGAGKSSLTGVLKGERNDLSTNIDVDKIATRQGVGNLAAGKIAVNKMDQLLDMGASFTQETTLSGLRTEATCRRAKENGYYIRLYYVGLNTAEESLHRIENHVAKGGNNIPDDDVLRRFGSRFDSLIKILPYCDEATFCDNENGFVKIADYQNGELILKGDYRPAWLVELISAL